MATLIQDFITENNSTKQGSSHDIREQDIQIENQKSMQEKNNEQMLSLQKERAQEEMLRVKLSLEIERKQTLMKEERFKRKNQSSLQSQGSFKSDFIPKLCNAIVCPVRTGDAPAVQLAWFADSLDILYNVETYQLSLVGQDDQSTGKLAQIKHQLKEITKFRHPHAPIFHDYEIAHVGDTVIVRLLTSDFRGTRLSIILRASDALPIRTAANVTSSLLSLLEDCEKAGLPHGEIDITNIWFDAQMHIVLDGLFYFPMVQGKSCLF